MPGEPDPVPKSVWLALFTAATQLAELKPWEFATDGDLLGVTDAVTKEIRVGHVLGNAGMVFGAVFYRRHGIQWLLSTVQAESDPWPDSAVEVMDCIKVEWVPKAELTSEDKAAMTAAGFKTRGRGPIWPQFRSVRPGCHPWHLDATEARQLVSDLGQLTAFLRLFEAHPTLFHGRSHSEIPFLPAGALAGSISLDDLEWMPLVPLPDSSQDPDPVPESLIEALESLELAQDLSFEYDTRILFGASCMDEGRPRFGRVAMLAESSSGHVAGVDIEAATQPPAKTFQTSLAKLLLKAKLIPGTLVVLQSKHSAALDSLCTRLGIHLDVAVELSWIDQASDSLDDALKNRG